MFFFPSILNYILGKDEFTKDKFAEDIAFYLKITDKTIPEEQKLLLELGYWDCINLNEEAYRTKTNKLIEYMQNGIIPIDQYVTVFHFATRFNNLLGFNLEDLLDKFRKSLSTNIDKFSQVPSTKIRNEIHSETEFLEYLNIINNECVTLNEEIVIKNKEKNWLIKYEEFKNKHDNFIQESRVLNSDTSLEPYLSYFPSIQAAEFLLTLSKGQLISFAYYIKDRYKVHSVSHLAADKQFLEVLKERALAKQEDSGKDKMDKLALSILIEDIKKALSIINTHATDNTIN